MSLENPCALRLRKKFLSKAQHHCKGKMVFEDTADTHLCRGIVAFQTLTCTLRPGTDHCSAFSTQTIRSLGLFLKAL